MRVALHGAFDEISPHPSTELRMLAQCSPAMKNGGYLVLLRYVVHVLCYIVLTALPGSSCIS
jgi:hypothetical protein